MLVYYFVPFAYRAKPNLIIKELYVADGQRSKGVGNLLMKAVAREAEKTGCAMTKWWVAKWNERSVQFYERLGAQIDPDWHEFQMSEKSSRDFGRVVAQLDCGEFFRVRGRGLIEQFRVIACLAVLPVALVIRVTGDERQRDRRFRVNHLLGALIDFAPRVRLFKC